MSSIYQDVSRNWWFIDHKRNKPVGPFKNKKQARAAKKVQNKNDKTLSQCTPANPRIFPKLLVVEDSLKDRLAKNIPPRVSYSSNSSNSSKILFSSSKIWSP